MLLRQTLLYLPAQIITPMSQLLAVVVWSHLLSLSDLGAIGLIVAAQEILYAVTTRWWAQYMLRQGKSTLDRPQFLGTEMSIILLALAVTALAGYLFPLRYLGYDSVQISLITAAFFASRSAINYLSDRARSEQLITLYSIVQILSFGGGTLLGLVPALSRELQLSDVMLGYLVAQAVCLAIVLIFTDFGRSLPRLNRTMLQAATKYGLPVMFAQAASSLAVNAPRFLVDRLFGIEMAGAFGVAYTIGIRISSFAVTIVTPAAFPLAAKKLKTHGLSAALDQLSKNMILAYFVIIAAAFGTLAINNILIEVLVPQEIWGVVQLVLPFAVLAGMVRFMRTHATDQIFMLADQTPLVLLISVLDCAGCILLVWIAATYFGYVGVVAGALASGLLALVASQIIARQRFGFPTPLFAIAKSLLCGIVMAIAVFAFSESMALQPTVNLVASIVLGVVVFSVLSLLLLRRELLTTLRMT